MKKESKFDSFSFFLATTLLDAYNLVAIEFDSQIWMCAIRILHC